MIQEKDLSLATVGRIRTGLALCGTVIGYLALIPEQAAAVYSLLVIGLCLSVYSCYLWAKLKGRHWIWMGFGLLAPAGFFMLAMLPDKNQKPPQAPV